MNQLGLVVLSPAAALLIVAGPGVVVAAPTADAACRVRAATPLDERVEQESLKGVQSLARFIHRTRAIHQLDLRTEVAKIDARRELEQDCLARKKQPTTIVGVDDPASPASIARTR